MKFENSGNIQIEITCDKPGYLSQKRRFNLRQVIEQKEISAKFNLVRRKTDPSPRHIKNETRESLIPVSLLYLSMCICIGRRAQPRRAERSTARTRAVSSRSEKGLMM